MGEVRVSCGQRTDLCTGHVTLSSSNLVLRPHCWLSVLLREGLSRLHLVSEAEDVLLCSGDHAGDGGLQGRTILLVVLTVSVTVAPLIDRDALVVTAPELILPTLHVTVGLVRPVRTVGDAVTDSS